MTIEPKPDEAPDAPKRFYRVGSTWVDLAAVAAVAVETDGYTLHLSGGQAVALPAAETAAVLKRLGLPGPKKRRSGGGKERRSAPKVAAGGLLAAIAGFFSG